MHSRADWERETAKVLRKSKRMSDDDADDLVWQKLTRTTLDGIAVAPLGTPDLLDDLTTAGRPTRAGAWDIRAFYSPGDAKTVNEEALVDLNGGTTSLWLAVDDDADWATTLHEVLLDLAPVVLDARGDAAAAARSFLEHAGDRELHPATNLGVPAAAATRRDRRARPRTRHPGLRRRRHARARPGRLRRPGARRTAWRSRLPTCAR